jgi:hypothetical protein
MSKRKSDTAESSSAPKRTAAPNLDTGLDEEEMQLLEEIVSGDMTIVDNENTDQIIEQAASNG